LINKEIEDVRRRYEIRRYTKNKGLYDHINPYVCMVQQEKLRALCRWARLSEVSSLSEMKILEIGCGYGTNLILLSMLGVPPENMVGNELLSERLNEARRRLPEEVLLVAGDASELSFPPESFDVVFQSTVFTSILHNVNQVHLSRKMWSLLKIGGGILWYDFIYNNPNNPDVKGVPLKKVRQLFPEGKMKFWRITLAPPIGRLVTHLHPSLYTLFNLFPMLRTHILCWIVKR